MRLLRTVLSPAAFGLGLMAAGGAALAPGQAFGQDLGQVVSSVLVVDRDRLFRESAYGKRIAAILEAERARQEAETARIEAELEQEEKDLTARRADLPADEFRALADAYDAKVQTLREERNAASQNHARLIEQAQVAFLQKVLPVLARIMTERGALVLMDRRSVILSANVDITQAAIDRIDAEIGDGAGLIDLPGLEATPDGAGTAPADGGN